MQLQRKTRLLTHFQLALPLLSLNPPPFASSPCQVSVTSLNMTVRKQEYDRIARENQVRWRRCLTS